MQGGTYGRASHMGMQLDQWPVPCTTGVLASHAGGGGSAGIMDERMDTLTRHESQSTWAGFIGGRWSMGPARMCRTQRGLDLWNGNGGHVLGQKTSADGGGLRSMIGSEHEGAG